ncbi:divergent polysaccharide deacetylase family protein [Mesorhizobium sp. BE184]|uniref:divergent polysaccharide deacetylase family protein n=1 Tax=Mesorhizobium sp. BE184 TaxID=2817714 RepID=UPI002858020E|nr:divergent polysaccharide deacetylase family protein [Mesorhizobium sp. BE184]MDR7033631.1 polysaccharide deacetylase 2 family uncharacterized protein YibQ [Mesorhizobium sp. BE184]
MAQSIKEIERPLGQDRRPDVPGRRFGMGVKQIAGLVAMLVLVGISGAIALRDKPFRKAEEIAAVKPAPSPALQTKPEPTASKPADPASLAAARPDGPQIIHVQPTDTGGAAGITVRDPSALGQNLATAHMPDRALIEDSATGPLPIRAADGRRPFDVYARPWSGGRGARVAIVIGGLAVSQTGTQAAITKLPAEVTLAFAPQGNSIGRWMQEARRRGHEIVMQIPLEPFDYPNVNPGRNTLTVDADADENLKNLRWALSRTTNYTAVMNYMGARFATDAGAMEPIIAELGKRGLGYLDDGSTARSVASEIALKEGVPLAIGDTTIDAVQDRGSILKKLDQLEATARAKGFAIGIGSAFNVTVDAVDAWADEAKKRGIEIVPISAVATDPQRR